jgi:hypothetical protein
MGFEIVTVTHSIQPQHDLLDHLLTLNRQKMVYPHKGIQGISINTNLSPIIDRFVPIFVSLVYGELPGTLESLVFGLEVE